MTKEQRIEYNKLCASFLGYGDPCYDNVFYFVYNKNNDYDFLIPAMLELNYSTEFLTNWNWIMIVVERICQTGFRKYSYSCEEHSRCVFTDMAILHQPHQFGGGNIIADSNNCVTEKEAVVSAIYNFLNWYNNECKTN
jgi:hypothetical protein